MTIRTRNRLNIILFIISTIILLSEIFLLLWQLLTKNLNIQLLYTSKSTFFLTKYNPYVVIGALYFQITYVSVSSIILFRSFEKTQASDIVYFYLFLVACLVDSFRLLIPLLNISETYSNLLIFCGNASLFARLMIPLSLLCTTILGTVEQRQEIEKNIFIITLLSIFFAQIIPLNTAVTCPNYSVDYSFKNTLNIASIIIIVASIVYLFVENKNHLYSQKTTMGFLLLALGIYCLFDATNLLKLIIAASFLSVGTFMYLKELHNQYLWKE